MKQEMKKHCAIPLSNGKFVLAWDNECEMCKKGIKHEAREIEDKEIPLIKENLIN